MDLKNVKRNDPCPCGSGKKFKNCHMGREDQIVTSRFGADPAQVALQITRLPPCRHPRAEQMLAGLELVSAAGNPITCKLVDLTAYHQLTHQQRRVMPQGAGGVLINPQKTRALDPHSVYLALSPEAEDSTVVHQLAHLADLVMGSRLPLGAAAELGEQSGVPVELLEHPQQFGDKLLELAQRFEVELDAEDEIIAFLARRQLLLDAGLIAKGQKEPLVAAAEKAMRFLSDHRQEIDARIKDRPGYTGQSASD